jgi:hypothetical protein
MASFDYRRRESFANGLVIIATHSGSHIGTLEVITRRHVRDENLLGRLCDWHNRSLNHYFNQTKWQVSSTAAWLATTVISSDSRLLFLVNDQDGSRIGLCGLSKIDGTHAEIYDVVRGETGGHSRLLPYAEITLLRLSFHGMGLQSVSGQVRSDNIMARRMGRFVGFEECDSVADCHSSVNTSATFNDPNPTAYRRILLRISRERFAEQHATLNSLPEFHPSWMADAS